jgi:predicted Ser/Thr protein kinase
MPSTGALEPGSVVGGYRIDELIGRGGMGVVYRTTNVALGRIYALKVLAPELAGDEQFRQRFRREMQIAASLHHPNVVPIHYAGEVQGMLFFVMDFIPGTNLHDVMRRSGPLDPNRATALLTQLAGALDAAHGRGLVHRDVKPENVLITVRDGEEHAYLTDFGLAKKLEPTSDLSSLTRKGAIVGTVDYMSPEQITGGHTDARTDIYALGCVYFQMLTGHVPYDGENSVATMFAHLHDPPPRLAGALCKEYPNFSAVVEKATAKEPEDRYLSAGDLARDAAAALSGKRYTGAPNVVATGEANPLPGFGALAQAGIEPKGGKDAPGRTVVEHEAEPYAGVSAGAETRLGTEPGKSAAPLPPPIQHNNPGAAPGQPPPARPNPRSPTGPRRRPGWHRWALLAGLLCVAGAVAAVIALTSGSSSSHPNNSFRAAAGPVPTNRVTGSGTMTLMLKGDVAAVTVHAHGLVNQLHWMHIHGGTGVCPATGSAQRKNGHLFVSATIGDSIYGPPAVSLTTSGDTSAKSHLDPTRYKKTGNFNYNRTVNVGGTTARQIRNGFAVLVVHGINYDGKRTYDNFLGPGEEQGAPALCGIIKPGQSTAAQARPSQGTVYTASLAPYSSSEARQLARLVWLCHPAGATSNPSPGSAEDRPRRRT